MQIKVSIGFPGAGYFHEAINIGLHLLKLSIWLVVSESIADFWQCILHSTTLEDPIQQILLTSFQLQSPTATIIREARYTQ
jgi:hypothetical protein